MKTNRNIIIVTAAISIGLAGFSFASTPGKHAAEFFPHIHNANKVSTTHVEHTLLKRTGPPGKGMMR